MKRDIKMIKYHRNGVCGEPFHHIQFKEGKDTLIAIQFDSGQTAVINPGDLSQAYRGDTYQAFARGAIQEFQEQLQFYKGLVGR